jgi:hypothetical protein
MKKLIAMTKLKRMVLLVLLGVARLIHDALTTHASIFSIAPAVLGALMDKIDETDAAQKAAATGGSAERGTRDALWKELLDQLYLISLAVERASAGSRAIAGLSLFPLVKIREPKPAISSVGTPNAKPGPSTGGLLISLTTVIGAESYEYKLSTDPLLPMAQWASVGCGNVKCLVEDLVPGQRYYICVAALGKNMQCVYSPVINTICL